MQTNLIDSMFSEELDKPLHFERDSSMTRQGPICFNHVFRLHHPVSVRCGSGTGATRS